MVAVHERRHGEEILEALTPPPARTVLMGTDQDVVTEFPLLRVTDSNPLPAPLRSQRWKTLWGWRLLELEYTSGDVSSATAA